MSTVELNPTRCHTVEEKDDRSKVHAAHPDRPGWTVCGLINNEPECCRPNFLPGGNTLCGQCNRRICAHCIEIVLAWLNLGRTPAGQPVRQPRWP
jgi:hypothetical protein